MRLEVWVVDTGTTLKVFDTERCARDYAAKLTPEVRAKTAIWNMSSSK